MRDKHTATSKNRHRTLLYLAQCPDAHLFLLCLAVCAIFAHYMVLMHTLPLHFFPPGQVMFDTAQLLFDDPRLTEFRTWDAVHFFRIAENGYTEEHLRVFFPLLPTVIRLVTWVTKHLVPQLNRLAPVSLYCSVLNMIAFAASAVILRRITIITLMGHVALKRVGVTTAGSGRVGDSQRLLSWIARPLQRCWRVASCDHVASLDAQAEAGVGGTLLDEWSVPTASCSVGERWHVVGGAVFFWLFNPALVFRVAVYTESLFSLFTFLGIYLIAVPAGSLGESLGEETRKGRVVWQAPCTSGRELLALGFFVLSATTRSNGILNLGFLVYPHFLQLCFPATYHRRWQRLHPSIKGHHRDTNQLATRYPRPRRVAFLILAAAAMAAPSMIMNYQGYRDFVGSWPPEEQTAFGSSFWRFYGSLQRKYWNLGLFTAYSWSNFFNILSAAPVNLLVSYTSYYFVVEPLQRSVADTSASGAHAVFAYAEGLVQSSSLVLLWLQCLLALLVMHVQVVNRFVTCIPALYWLAGMHFARHAARWDTRALLMCMAAFLVVGGWFFGIHLPWT